jgi:hypothetical protein
VPLHLEGVLRGSLILSEAVHGAAESKDLRTMHIAELLEEATR